MFDKIRKVDLFAKLFSFGLLLLFAEFFVKYLGGGGKNGFFRFETISFFTAGAIVCLVSLLFLLTEWVMLPYGTHVKRVKLYQGAGNLLALAILGGSYFLTENQTAQNFAGNAALALCLGGLLLAVVFGFLGKPIADYLSRKKIKLTLATARKLPQQTGAMLIAGKNKAAISRLKVRKLTPKTR